MNDINWLFFDVGSALIDETECYNHRIAEYVLKFLCEKGYNIGIIAN